MKKTTLTDGSPVTADHREINPLTGMQKGYVVLSEEERAKGFVRPVRQSYVHEKCGGLTTMGLALAETYALELDSHMNIDIKFTATDPNVEISDKLQAQYPHHLVLVQAGNFMHAFNKSAYALHTLKQYKIRLAGPPNKPHLLVGFPVANYKQRLWPIVDDHNISYVIVNKTDIDICEASAPSYALDAISDDIVNQVIADLITSKQLNTSTTAKALANPNTQDFIFKTKAAELDTKLLQDIIKLPRDIRVTWGENVRYTMQRIMRNTYLYGNEDNKPQLLKQLSADVDLIRHYICQAQALNLLKASFEHRVGLVVELGRILGGLQRAQRTTS